MDNTEQASAAALAGELKTRLPIATFHQRHDLVIENDLAGRVALAVHWQYRQQFTIQLITDDPTDYNAQALKAGLEAVRKAPKVHLVSTHDAELLAAAADRLIWAVSAQRTSPETRATLQDREPQHTWLLFLAPLNALNDEHPNQLNPAHELVLRDVIRDHARFLNFFGDRFNPADLYERFKYPSWFRPPEGFTAAIPAVEYVIETADGTEQSSHEFTGTLQLETAQILEGQRANLEFSPICAAFHKAFDVTLQLRNDYVNPAAAGTLEIQVQRDQKTVHTIDVATSEPKVQIPLAGLTPGTRLSVALVVLRDNPQPSWSKASQTQVYLTGYPQGTHRVPTLMGRAAAWLKRAVQQRQRGNS